jgi:hypothetical protein
MSLLKVGIHDDLALSPKTQINEHGTLELYIASVQSEAAVLAAFMDNTVFQSMESNIRFYPPNITDFHKKAKTSAEIGKDLMVIRHQLTTYGELYATKDEVAAAFGGTAMFEGLGIPPEDYGKAVTMLTQEPFLLKVCTNLCQKFVDFMLAKNGFNGEVTFRQKFLRQSEAKNYATISKSDFDVWLEPMTVPKSASKIAYTDYEIKEKKNLSHPISSDKSQAKPKDAAKANKLFNTPTTTTATSTAPDLFKKDEAPVEEKASPADKFKK